MSTSTGDLCQIEAGERVLVSVSRYLERKLKVKVNQAKSHVKLVKESVVLGFEIHRKKLRTQNCKVKAFKRELKHITRRCPGTSIAARITRLKSYIQGWMAHYGCGLKYNDAVNLDGWMDQETTADGVLETVALTQASNPGIDQAGGEHARSHYVRPIAQKLLAAIYSGHSDVLSKAFSRLNDQFSIHVLMHDEESATNTNQSYLSPTPFYNRFPSLFLAEATLIGEPL